MIALALTLVPIPVTFVDGNDLFRTCEPRRRSATCAAYVLGVSDTFTTVASEAGPLKPRICLSKDMTGGQLADVVYNYLRDHPQTRHLGAAGLVFEALRTAFPCRAGL